MGEGITWIKGGTYCSPAAEIMAITQPVFQTRVKPATRVGTPRWRGTFPHGGQHGDPGDRGRQQPGAAAPMPASDPMALVATHHLLGAMRRHRVLLPAQEQNQVLMQASFVCVHFLWGLCILSIEN